MGKAERRRGGGKDGKREGKIEGGKEGGKERGRMDGGSVCLLYSTRPHPSASTTHLCLL